MTTLKESIETTISSYNLLPKGEKLAVAFSGGKDSLFLCNALADLGISFQAVTVDMGYEQGWGKRVEAIADAAGFFTEVITVDGPECRAFLSTEDNLNLDGQLNILSDLDSVSYLTPCTYCYNSKIYALKSFLDKNGVSRIAFGHHATDAVSSFLKSAFMHIDRYSFGNERFDLERFRALCDNVELEFDSVRGESAWIGKAADLASSHNAATNEPPAQLLHIGNSQYTIIRPMFTIWESQIRSALPIGVQTLPSGCGHGTTKENRTPREIVRDIVQKIEKSDMPIANKIISIMKTTVNDDGYVVRDVRRDRNDILGQSYKPFSGNIDKL